MNKTMLGLAAVSVLGVSSVALADDPGITSPGFNELIYSNSLELTAMDTAAALNNAQWAVRAGTCAAGTNTRAGNVDGFNTLYTWTDGEFNATVDITGWPSGEYCFVLNTLSGSAAGNRLTQEFYIVRDYAKVSGRVDDPVLVDKQGRGMPLYTFSGFLGIAGTETVGSVSVNYKAAGDVCEFTGGVLTFPQAGKAYYAGANYACKSGSTGKADIAIYDRSWTPEAQYCRNQNTRGCLGVNADESLDSPFRVSEYLANGGVGFESFSADIDAGNGIVVQ